MVEDIVLLHGFGGTRRAWDGVLAHLPAERYRPLALDLLGHGEEADAPRPITLDGCVASVLDRSPERFVLAGYSMGGRIALRVALASPERVARLVLVASGPGIEDAVERAERRAADRALADAIEVGSIEDFLAHWCAQPMFAGDPPEVDAQARADYRRNDPRQLAVVLRALGQGEMASLWGRLSELTMSVTVLAGDRDASYQEIARRMVASLPSARLVAVPGGHRLPLESPMEVASAMG